MCDGNVTQINGRNTNDVKYLPPMTKVQDKLFTTVCLKGGIYVFGGSFMYDSDFKKIR